MFTNIRNGTIFSTSIACMTVGVGCHPDVGAITTSSATDEKDIFGTSTGASDTETVPTTSAGDTTGDGDPTDGGIDPTKFCKLQPDDDYPGVVHVCEGWMQGEVIFDYYGDVPITKGLACWDLTAEPFNLEKPSGYRYTCQIPKYVLFDPDDYALNGHRVEACCLRDTPFEAAADYCRVDAAEELCLMASDALLKLWLNVPGYPQLAELVDQLYNLNKHFGDSSTQTSCSQYFAKKALEYGDDVIKVTWPVEHPQALDPEVGWPMFRDIRLEVFTLEIWSVESDGLACSDIGGDAVAGDIGEGTLILDDQAKAKVGGAATYRRSDCRLQACEFRLETFSLEVGDFDIGAYSFTDVSFNLTTPAVGLIKDSSIRVPDSRMHLTASFRVAEGGRPMFDGAPMSVDLRNRDAALLRLLPDGSIAVENLNVTRWPLDIRIVSQVSL